MKHLVWLGGFVMFASFAMAEEGPSFDCSKAATHTETLICEDAELAKLDRELDLAFKRVQTEDESYVDQLEMQQEKWLASRENCDEDEAQACVQRHYFARIDELNEAPWKRILKLFHGEQRFAYVKRGYKTGAEAQVVFKDELFEDEDLKFWTQELMDRIAGEYQHFYTDYNEDMKYWGVYSDLSRSYEDDTMTVLLEWTSTYFGGAYPNWMQNATIVDHELENAIVFWHMLDEDRLDEVSQLFTEMVWARAKELLIENDPMQQESAQEIEQEQEAEPKEPSIPFEYFEEQFVSRDIEEWLNVGFEKGENGKIAKIVVYGSDGEFGPHAVSAAFEHMDIDAAPFIPFISEKYRSSFVETAPDAEQGAQSAD